MINVTIYDKGGKIYRKYTEDTLITLYATSPLGANYELSVLVEGTVFMALLTYYAMRAEEVCYFEYVSQKYQPNQEGLLKS